MSAKIQIVSLIIGLIIIGAFVAYAFIKTPLTKQAYKELISIGDGN